MQICPVCSGSNRDTSKFCSACGAALNLAPQAWVPLQPGQVMKNSTYHIVRRLGKGGMGAVYLATQSIAGETRYCVVKEMLDYFDPQDPVETQRAREQFEAEAATLVSLNRAGIPQIYDYFSEAGRNYIVMQFIEGPNLEAGLSHADPDSGVWRPGQPMSVKEALEMSIQLCRVLEYLATRTDSKTGQPRPVIHHDLKPANVIRTADGTVWLVDFGTAKARLTPQPSGGVGMHKSGLYGTGGYAPPEMYPPRTTSEPRSDVYALGATLYHLLTDDDPRDHPFQFPGLAKLPAGVAQALARALEHDVTRRPSASEWRRQLEALLAPSAALPFVFRNKDVAHIPEELVPLCDRFWDEAREHLYQGRFAQWFSQLNRHDLVTQAEAIRQREADQDAGLEAFLHILDPALPKPQLEIQEQPLAQALNFGRMQVDQEKVRTIHLTNTSRGHLSGRVLVIPPTSWLSVAPLAFSGNAVTLTATVGSTGQPEQHHLRTTLRIETAYQPPVEIPVHAHVAFGWRALLTALGVAIPVASLLTGLLSWMVRQTTLTGLPHDLDHPLIWTWLVGAAALGLAVGRRRRGNFSRPAFLIGAIAGFLAFGYLTLAIAVEFLVLGLHGGETLAYVALVSLGAFLGLLAGLFQGLRRARRPVLAVATPSAVLAAGLLLFFGISQPSVQVIPWWLGDFQVPLTYLSFGPTPVLPPPPTPHPTPSLIKTRPAVVNVTLTSTVTTTPRPTARTPRTGPTPEPRTREPERPTLANPCAGRNASIVWPAPDARISGKVAVRGHADDTSDPGFQFYKVEWSKGERRDLQNDSGWSSLSDINRTPITAEDGVLDTWDTTVLEPGVYTLRLTVVDLTANHPDENICAVKVMIAK